MIDKYLRIFFLDLSMLFGKFELNDNFSLKKDNNIYVGGEMIDIDGECGGYNIGIAFLSGLYIGEVI